MLRLRKRIKTTRKGRGPLLKSFVPRGERPYATGNCLRASSRSIKPHGTQEKRFGSVAGTRRHVGVRKPTQEKKPSGKTSNGRLSAAVIAGRKCLRHNLQGEKA